MEDGYPRRTRFPSGIQIDDHAAFVADPTSDDPTVASYAKFNGEAGPASILLSIGLSSAYQNTGTLESNIWTPLGSGSGSGSYSIVSELPKLSDAVENRVYIVADGGGAFIKQDAHVGSTPTTAVAKDYVRANFDGAGELLGGRSGVSDHVFYDTSRGFGYLYVYNSTVSIWVVATPDQIANDLFPLGYEWLDPDNRNRSAEYASEAAVRTYLAGRRFPAYDSGISYVYYDEALKKVRVVVGVPSSTLGWVALNRGAVFGNRLPALDSAEENRVYVTVGGGGYVKQPAATGADDYTDDNIIGVTTQLPFPTGVVGNLVYNAHPLSIGDYQFHVFAVSGWSVASAAAMAAALPAGYAWIDPTNSQHANAFATDALVRASLAARTGAATYDRSTIYLYVNTTSNTVRAISSLAAIPVRWVSLAGDVLDLGEDILIFADTTRAATGAGTDPAVSAAYTYYNDIAGPASLLVHLARKALYINTGTKAANVWSRLT